MEAPARIHEFPKNSTAASRIAPSAGVRARLSLPSLWNGVPIAAISAFARGFLGGLMGGLAYSVAPDWLQLRELPYAGAFILLLATVFGAFEIWRVAQARDPKLVRARMLLVLVASVVALLAVVELTFSPDPPSQQNSNPVRIAPSKIVVC